MFLNKSSIFLLLGFCAIFRFTPVKSETLLIDTLADLENPEAEGWESRCPGYHPIEVFTCGSSTYLIPEAERNGHEGYWAQCSEDQTALFCYLNYRPVEADKNKWKQLQILAYFHGQSSLEIIFEDSVGFHTGFYGGNGWETLVLDLSQYSGIKDIEIVPEYHPSSYAIIDQITLSDDLVPTTTTTTAAPTIPTTPVPTPPVTDTSAAPTTPAP